MNSPAQPRTWFVSRHPGAVAWAQARGLVIDCWVAHLDPETVSPRDTVMGSLPVNLAAEVCARGARYMHLSLRLPAAWRGRELSASQLGNFQPELREFKVIATEDQPS